MIRRFVTLCLALLLPLQFAWGAAATHCQHEAAPSFGGHFGHHAHVHDASVKAPASGTSSVDADCAYCHAATPQAVSNPAIGFSASSPPPYADAAPQPAPRSAPTRVPDRPQWPRLA